jgi:hypothetical protein
MALAAKAFSVRFPHDFGRTQNDFGVQKMAASAASQSVAMPAQWSGRWVLIYIPTGGADIQFACSKVPDGAKALASQEVDTAAATSTTFPTLKVGLPFPAGQIHQMELPKWDRNETGYLVFESSGAQTFYLALGDTGV